MAKLTILAAALVSILAIAQATRTTITTTVVEEETPGQQQQSCHEQIQREQSLRHCQMYLQQQGRREYEVVMITEQNPRQQQHLQQCCQNLENLDEQCRCEGVREAMSQQQEGKRQGEEMREMVQQAEMLPSRCNLRPRRCQIRDSWF